MQHSAGILLYRWGENSGEWELLVVRPGGPYWTGRTKHVYGVPKGLYAPGEEDAIKCARREFAEETGGEAPREDALAKLGSFRTSSSKSVHVWVCEQDFDVNTLQSNTFEMEWPKGSGVIRRYPEVESAAWIRLSVAEASMHVNQAEMARAMATYLASVHRRKPT